MKTTNNTILITGGGSGIGRGLAEAFHALGNQVIISGRTPKTLGETTNANPGMKSLIVDMIDPASIHNFATQLAAEYPSLNVLINNAGIMRMEKLLTQPDELADVEATIATNLLGPIRLTAALMPHLRKQPAAAVMMVSSGLAFVPLAMAPTYNATKAAIHSYAESLRYQLKKTNIEVLELIPPYVQTALLGEQQTKDPMAMPLDEFIAEVMDILTTQPEATEICVDKVLTMRFAAETGQEKYQQFFQGFNDAFEKAASDAATEAK